MRCRCRCSCRWAKRRRSPGLSIWYAIKRCLDSGDPADPIRAEAVPDEFAERASTAREQLLEAVADVDDEIAEAYLAGETIGVDALVAAIRRACVAVRIVPVLCGTALRNKGVRPLLDAVVDYLPSPPEAPPVSGVDPKDTDSTVVREPRVAEPLAMLVFKVAMDEGRKIVYMRLFSGSVAPGDEVLNVPDRKEGEVGAPFRSACQSPAAHRQGGGRANRCRFRTQGSDHGRYVVRYRQSYFARAHRYLRTCYFPSLLNRYTNAEKEKLDFALAKMVEEDPTFHVDEDDETGQTIIRGMGELHLEIIGR